MSLDLTPTGLCPTCAGALVERTVEQPALLRHGGYGATRRTVEAVCANPNCDWWAHRETSEMRP